MAASSDTVLFLVAGKEFSVSVADLRLSKNPESLLTRAVLTATNSEDPIVVEGDAELFPYILDIHRLLTLTGVRTFVDMQSKCYIPLTVSKAAVLNEAQKFGLMVSASDIVQDEGQVWDRFGNKGYAIICSQGDKNVNYEIFRDWTAIQVADWLKTFQQGRFAAFAERFISNGIDGLALSTVTDDDLKKYGMLEPRLRAVFMSGLESAWDAFVDTNEELARVALQKQREATADSEDEETSNPIDAAALTLQTMFGKGGTREMFTAIIDKWRAENSLVSGGADAALKAPETDKSHKGILVAARIRPVLANGSDSPALEVGDFESLTALAAANAKVVVHSCGTQRDGSTPKVEHKSFLLHRALGPTCAEEDVLDLVVPLVDTAVKRCVHTTLLCYGQTGSGKTHTVGHLAQNVSQHLFKNLGAKRVALEAFELKGGAKGLVITSSQAFSLHADSKPELPLFEGQDGVVHVGGSNAVANEPGQALNLSHCALASSQEELLQFFVDATQRRCSTDTKRNAASSRTHAFYRFHLAEASESGNDCVIGTGACIELVDLAGSESNKDALYHNKARIDERAKINSSLQALNTCIQKTIQGSSFVPFRADKLTQLLRPCFERRDKTLNGVATVLFMACLSPLASDSSQSMRTLTYTQQLTGVVAKPKQCAAGKRFQAEGLKRLAVAVETGDADQIRQALAIAQHNGVTGPERRRAIEFLQKLDALEAEENRDPQVS